MTLPAQSLPDATDPDLGPDQTPPTREVSSPAAFIAVVAVSALVIILCVLGATMSGLFNFVAAPDPTAGTSPSAIARPSGLVNGVSFPDGQWLVPTDVAPGTYSVTVPAGSPGCTWERNASTDGTASSVLESGGGKEGEALVVSVRVTDKVFQSKDCGVWQRKGE